MKRKFRAVSAIVVACTAFAVTGLFVPSASAAPDRTLVFLSPPQDSVAGDSIRSSDFNETTDFVRVALVDANNQIVTNSNAKVTFTLNGAPGFVVNSSLTVVAQPLVSGIATFGPVNGKPTLSIGTANEPQFTSYSLVPSTAGGGPKITGLPSGAFDIFHDGETCPAGQTCDAQTQHAGAGGGSESYSVLAVGTAGDNTTLGASTVPEGTLPGFECAGQKEVFPTDVFVNVTTETEESDGFEPVLVVSHITRQDMKRSANNGQAHIQWCVGLKNQTDWTNGVIPTPLNLDGDVEAELWVGFAPPCPQASPWLSAPCIVSQTGDGNGGSTTTGWLPGGDPPRRT